MRSPPSKMHRSLFGPNFAFLRSNFLQMISRSNTCRKWAPFRDRARARIRSITERPSLSPTSSTRHAVGSPCGSPTPRVTSRGARRAYLVPCVYPMNRLGPAHTPVGVDVRAWGRGIPMTNPRRRFGSSLSASLACCTSRCCSGSHMLTLRFDPSSQPSRC